MNLASSWPHWLDHIWAKSCLPGNSAGESLAAHTWNVLVRLRQHMEDRPWLPQVAGERNLWNVLFWSVFFHDWGKAASGFQRVVHGGKKCENRWPHRHEVLSLVFLSWIEDALSEPDLTSVTAAIASHHRDAAELRELYPISLVEEEDPLAPLVLELEEDTVRGLWRWFSIAGEWIQSLGLDEFGITGPPVSPNMEAAVAEVISSGRDAIRRRLSAYWRWVRRLEAAPLSPGVIGGILLRGETIQADHQASAHVQSHSPFAVTRDSLLQRAGLQARTLYDHQQLAGEKAGSSVLVAPTGSGKTEAALLWFANVRLVGRNSAPRFFYVLPYQASMNAMYDRLNALFPGATGLVHGRALVALYRRMMEEDHTPANAVQTARWAHDLARLNYHPVRIFSPYEMLKSAYQTKGYEARLADYAGASFVLDEIHAYEPRRLALILELVRYLRDHLDARFFIMSATMPQVVRQRVEDVLGEPTFICSSQALFAEFARHRVRILKGRLLSTAGIDLVLSAFRGGHSVLVTCNTVANAQVFYGQLTSQLPDHKGDMILVHGRFHSRDRQGKEREIIEATGVGSPRRRPVIVVATQVVEVSLNIDLDVLFTEPAPLEALVQRFGRVNRSRRKTEAPVNIFTEPADGQRIYDPDLVAGALRVLATNANGLIINEASVQVWLDQVYTGTVLQRWEDDYTQAATEFRDVFLGNLRPFQSDSTLEEQFEKLFDGAEVLPASLQEEYNALRETNPIEASGLLLPIAWRRLMQLRRAGLIRPGPGHGPPVVEVPYTDRGLVFSA